MKRVWLARGLTRRRKHLRAALRGCLIVWSIAAGVMLTGCSTTTPPSPHPTALYVRPSANASQAQVVTASWYGSEFRGRRTSSGETFNPEEMTAASRSLPMGSRVRVTNVANGRTVVVRINDRGPFVKGRSLDLSHGAAQRIGLTRKGVGRVQVERAGAAAAQRSPPPAISRVSYASAAPWSEWRPRITLSRAPSHTSRHHRRSHRRIVSNPIGDWILSALPHF